MRRGNEPFGKRPSPIAEFKSVEEEYNKGVLLKRRERNVAIYVTPLLAVGIVVVLIFSPESRALALEIGAKGVEFGRDWILRGLLE